MIFFLQISRKLFLLILLALPLFSYGSGQVKHARMRAVWVTRFDYREPDDVHAIMLNLRRFGFTDVFFQVRGNGTVFYESSREPWACELSGGALDSLGNDPGWDPLREAVRIGHRQGLRIHAYLNVLPGWRGREKPPPGSSQLWNKHRDWFMVDRLNYRMQPTSKWYSFLNPVHPGVRRHLFALFREMRNYAVDGVHLDYIRYPHDYHLVAREIYPDASKEELKKHSSFSYDPISRRLFMRYPGSWTQFRRDAISDLVRDIRTAVGDEKTISASLIADLRDGRGAAFQSGPEWLQTGLINLAVPMNYNAQKFRSRLERFIGAVGEKAARRGLLVGINGKHSPAEIRREIELVESSPCRGYAFFAYSYLFKNHRLTEKGRALIGK